VKTRRKPIIAQTIWLFDKWSRFSVIRRWYLKKLLREADVLTTHTAHYLEKIAQILPDKSPTLLPFGVSANAFPLSEPRENIHLPIRILSAGNDSARDWATLLAAFGNDNRFEVVVFSRKLKDNYAKAVSNFELRRDPNANDFRSLYLWSDYVVIPMIENLYGGITVALEATRMGSAVVCSATGGVSTYFGEDEALFVSCESPVDLREAILTCSPTARLSRIRKAQARCQREDYSSRGMIKRYVFLSNRILSGTARDLAAS
jgi:glycosyltransferase involved in cell wall biosynthesis